MASVNCLRFCGDIPGVPIGSMLAVGYSDSAIDVFVLADDEYVKKRVRHRIAGHAIILPCTHPATRSHPSVVGKW